eukprot:COSAG05_NODE_487_length_9342_cov_4.078979_5_plen_125_part_00
MALAWRADLWRPKTTPSERRGAIEPHTLARTYTRFRGEDRRHCCPEHDVRAAVAQIEIQEKYGYRYEGEVNQDGKWHGQGVVSYSNGYRYVGEQRNNFRHGHGTGTYADGRVESGKWENGRFLG